MASIRSRARMDGVVSHQVIYRRGGRGTAQEFATFDDLREAERFRNNIDRLGIEAALDILGAREGSSLSPTLAEWCVEYVDNLTGVTEGTRDKYRRYTRRDLGALGDLPVDSINERAIAKWVNAMEATGAAAKTISNKHGFVFGALEGAIRAHHIGANPCKGTRLPRTESGEKVFLTHSEFATLLNYIRPDARDLTTVMVATGARWGEATALQVRDWDAGHNRLTISRAWKYTGTQARTLGAPKTNRSRRTISIPSQGAEILNRATQGKAPEDFLFTNALGNPWTSQNFHANVWQPAVATANGEDWEARRALQESSRRTSSKRHGAGHRDPWRKPAEIPLGKRPRVHDLRHAAASWMLQAGIPIPVVSRNLGHESIKTTVDTYGHLAPTDMDAVAAAMEIALSPAYPEIEA